jgi:hypothetical protein
MNVSPHLVVAGVLVVLALCATLGPICTGTGSYPIPVTDLKIAATAEDKTVTTADAAIMPLIPTLSHLPDSNPFVLRKVGAEVGIKLAFPPPPPVQLPAPPILPLAER